LFLLAALTLAGCGGSTPSQPAAAAGLTIVFNDGHGKVSTWQLSCDPPGGTHPDPKAACEALQRGAATALAPVDKTKVCAQLFGGPESAVLTGNWQGRSVDSHLNLKDSCQIARWKALEGLLPHPSR
jgi:hypothetical protein